MGVDYTAHYGFGVKVTHIPDLNNTGDDIGNLDDLLYTSKYEYFTTGSFYRDEDLEHYVIYPEVEYLIDKQNGYNFLEQVSGDLVEFLQRKGIGFEGVPNIVGGLRIS